MSFARCREWFDQDREVTLVGTAPCSVPEHQRRCMHDYILTDDGSCADLEWRAGSGGSGEFIRFLQDEFDPLIT